MLEIDDVYVTYGGAIKATHGVTFAVFEGSVTAVLGANGAGKTTLMRAISGVLGRHGGKVVHGRIAYEGRRIDTQPAWRIVSRGIVQSPEGRRVFSTLTVEENLQAGALSAKDRSKQRQRRDQVLDLFPILKERASQSAALLSGGEQQMLAIGRALMAAPRLLLLDEPSLGLAPKIVTQIGHVVAEINRSGTTVLLVEQNAAMALEVSDHAVVLDSGQVSLQGLSAELASSQSIRELYLGHSGMSVETQQTVSPRTIRRWPR